MSRRVVVLLVLASFALFVAAASGLLHRHDGAVRSDVGCLSCAAAGLTVVAPPPPAACLAPPEQPRPAPLLALTWPRLRARVDLSARGSPAA